METKTMRSTIRYAPVAMLAAGAGEVRVDLLRAGW
jgi:hypothetical protein